MIHSYVNLVTWRYFYHYENPPTKNKKNYIDSISLLLLVRLFIGETKKYSGMDYLEDFLERTREEDFIALGTLEIEEKYINTHVLPFWKNLEEIEIYESLINDIRNFKHTLIGISSPKQEILAKKINKVFPDMEIYCLGAALESGSKVRYTYFPNWVILLVLKPKRTARKIIKTFKEFFSLLLIRKRRNQFTEYFRQIL